jgi:hypothetical protein
MKSIIAIKAHCPTIEKKDDLAKLVNSLVPFKDQFTLIILSHTIVPQEICEKVNFVLYDEENPILEDLDSTNISWYMPFEGCKLRIHSTYVGMGNVHLAVQRLWSLGIGLAKTFQIDKIHFLEYDAVINDISEFSHNDILLDTYDSVFYTNNGSPEDFLRGCLISFNVNRLPKEVYPFNQEKFINLIHQSPSKAAELVIKNMLVKQNFYCKPFELLQNNNELAKSYNYKGTHKALWCVPFYDSVQDKLMYIASNTDYEEPLNITLIVNDNKIIKLNIVKFTWHLIEIDDFGKINSLTVLINNKIHNIFEFLPEYKAKFKVTNYSIPTNTPGQFY